MIENTRQFLEAVKAAEISKEVTDFAQEQLDKLDTRNAKRKSKPTKTQKENAPLVEEVYAILLAAGGALTANEIKDSLVPPVSVNKATALAKMVVADGRATQGEVHIKGKGKQKTYEVKIGE